MRCYVSIIVLSWLISSPVNSQDLKDDLEQIDRHIRHIPVTAAPELAQKLIAGCNTELGKTRAIFRWIAGNIDYKVNPIPQKIISNVKEDSSNLSLDERVAATVLENRTAICEGYARLFKTLCDYAGLESVIIHGYAKGTVRPTRFSTNHSWNAVRIDKKWALLDVSWASGYVSGNQNLFTREFDEKYFLPAPEQFIRDHYPDDLRWTLMEKAPLMPEYRYSPFKQRAFIKYRINSISPAKGIIEAKLGDIINFELKTSDLSKDQQIGSDTFLDTDVYNTASSILIYPFYINGSIISYQYEVCDPLIQWIYISYNEDVVLRYKLMLKE